MIYQYLSSNVPWRFPFGLYNTNFTDNLFIFIYFIYLYSLPFKIKGLWLTSIGEEVIVHNTDISLLTTLISPGDTHNSFWRTPEPLFLTRQHHRSKQSIVFHNKLDIAKTKEQFDLSLIPLICSSSILTIPDAFAWDSKGISSANKKTQKNKDFQCILLCQ